MNSKSVCRTLCGALVGWALVPAAVAGEVFRGSVDGGFILLSEQRYDPSVQRLLAERSLDALPLYNGRLFYIVPSHIDRGEQQAQIRYLEHMLNREATKAQSNPNPNQSDQQN